MAAPGGPDGLAGEHIRELGPDRGLDLLNCLALETRIASLKGVGRVPLEVRRRAASTASASVEHAYLLPYLQGLDAGSVDIVDSRS